MCSKKVQKLSDSTPKFGKEKEKMKISDWLFIVENNMDLLGIPDNKRIVTVSPFLRGTAFEMLKRYVNSGNLSWKEFREDLRLTFTPVDEEHAIRTKLINLRHTDSFDSYSREFQYLSYQLSDMSEKDRLACFLNGLKGKTYTELKLKDIKTLSEAIRLASILEMGRESTRENRVSLNYARTLKKQNNNNGQSKNKNNDNNSRAGKQCTFCKKSGHTQDTCFRKNNNQGSNRQTERGGQSQTHNNKSQQNNKHNNNCYNCNMPGHRKSECHATHKSNLAISEEEKHKRNESNNKQKEVESEEKSFFYKIYTYDIQINTAQTYKLFKINGIVNGKLLSIAIDTGPRKSIMGLNSAKKYGFIIEESECLMKTADGVIKKVCGIIFNCEVSVKGRTCELDLIVIDHQENDILLGLDWFHKTGASICPAENRLAFPNIDQTQKFSDELV